MLTAVNSVLGVSGAARASSAGVSLAQGSGAGAAPSTPFADLVHDAVGSVNRLEEQADQAINGLMTGSGVDVHQALIADQKAGMAFELVLSMRNKAVQAYQSVMNMQF